MIWEQLTSCAIPEEMLDEVKNTDRFLLKQLLIMMRIC
jgi:hypothetical protein